MKKSSGYILDSSGLLFRPRVDNLITKAAEHPLVMVTAGTGYGKSRSLQSWLTCHDEVTGIWMQITNLDNYSSRFWDIFKHAIQMKDPDLAYQMSNMGFPDSLEKTYQFIQALNKSLTNHHQFAIVFDDFHKITDNLIIEFVETIVFAGLEGLTVFLLSRHPLSIDYSSLYDNGLLERVTVSDLRFTSSEIQEFFRLQGIQFEKDILENIQISTEGWPLAIYLISLHHEKEGQLFNDPITCTIPLLYSLIEVEIFSVYPADVQQAFIEISMLESAPLELIKIICGDLFEQVTFHLQQNQFAYYNPLTGRYHFHRLFRRFLKTKRDNFTLEERNKIYLIAGEWFVEQQYHIEALSYFARANNYDSMWKIIMWYGNEGYSAEVAQLCITLLDTFSPEFVESHREILVFRGHLLLNLGEIERAHQSFLTIIAEFGSLPTSEKRRQIIGEAYIGLAHTYMIKGKYTFADCYKKAAEALPNGSMFLNDKHPYVGNHFAMVLFGNAPGELDLIVKTLIEIRPYADTAMNHCGYGSDLLAAAEAAYFQFKLDKAMEHSYKALYKALERNQHDIVCACRLLLLKIQFATGNYAGVRTEIEELRTYRHTMKDTYIYGMDEIALAWYSIKVGQYNDIPRWIIADTKSSKSKHQAPISIGREKLVYTSYLLSKRQFNALFPVCEQMESFFLSRNQLFSLLHTYIVESIASMHLDQPSRACAAFRKAYDLSVNNTLICYFVEYGGETCQLLDYVQAQGEKIDSYWYDHVYEEAEAFGTNLENMRENHEQQYGKIQSQQLSINEEELVILNLLACGYTKSQIAIESKKPLPAIKSTVKSIYTKLGALGRADAIRIAKELSLLQ